MYFLSEYETIQNIFYVPEVLNVQMNEIKKKLNF